MLTGGQVRSFSPSGGTVWASSAGASVLPPKRLLKRSPSDCEDAGEANMPHPTPSATAADIAILRDSTAVMIPRFSPIRRRSHLPTILRGPRYNSAMAANPRHAPNCENQGSAAKILMQQAEQQMVLPDAVDAEIAPRQTLAAETAFLQHRHPRRIGGNAGSPDAVKVELAEQRGQQHAQRRRHVAAMRMRLADPIADGAGLDDAAANIRQRDAADHRAVRFAEYDKRIGPVGGDVFG